MKNKMVFINKTGDVGKDSEGNWYILAGDRSEKCGYLKRPLSLDWMGETKKFFMNSLTLWELPDKFEDEIISLWEKYKSKEDIVENAKKCHRDLLKLKIRGDCWYGFGTVIRAQVIFEGGLKKKLTIYADHYETSGFDFKKKEDIIQILNIELGIVPRFYYGVR